jgi:hypothetical protein
LFWPSEGRERRAVREQGGEVLPVSLVKDLLFVIDLLAHAGAGDIDFSIRGTPFVIADRWLVRRFLLRALLPLLPSDPGRGSLRIEASASSEDRTAVIRASHPARLPIGWTESQRLARELGGELVPGSGPDGGTAVTIRLPLAAVRPPRKESSCATSERTSPCA